MATAAMAPPCCTALTDSVEVQYALRQYFGSPSKSHAALLHCTKPGWHKLWQHGRKQNETGRDTTGLCSTLACSLLFLW